MEYNPWSKPQANQHAGETICYVWRQFSHVQHLDQLVCHWLDRPSIGHRWAHQVGVVICRSGLAELPNVWQAASHVVCSHAAAPACIYHLQRKGNVHGGCYVNTGQGQAGLQSYFPNRKMTIAALKTLPAEEGLIVMQAFDHTSNDLLASEHNAS